MTVKVQSILSFSEGSSEIRIDRKILEMSNPDAQVEIDEYMVACYGTTEYSEDMCGITLSAKKGDAVSAIPYEYKCRELALEEADVVEAIVPQIDTKVSMKAAGPGKKGYVKEGYAFSPMFTLGYTAQAGDKEVVSTWLKLEKAN